MRYFSTVVYTDKLDEVKAFYDKHFKLKMDARDSHTLILWIFGEALIEYVDATWAGKAPSKGVTMRWLAPFIDLEYDRLKTAGLTVGEPTTAHWNSFTGNNVRYFELTDPAGSIIQLFEDHYGEERQLMTTGDGTGTKKVHQPRE